ncbi:MAG: tandem-95 repeat protein [Deltaproteobacteria bacterium]|nr:tandem-95 repeat protein [Deltaproteobacteria bacterium]
MNRTVLEKGLRGSALLLTALALTAGVSAGATYELRAAASSKTMPDSTVVQVWGFADDTTAGPGNGIVTIPGPRLVVPPGDTTLTIHLTNNLPEPVSLVIPGQPATLTPVTVTDFLGRTRVRAFTAETAPGAAGTYTWTGLRPGTYLYQSGTNPAKQVPMGLYGAVTADAAAGQAYPGVAYDAEVVLLYSELDATLNAAPAPAKPLRYKPQYYLVNGQSFPGDQGTFPPLLADGRILLRLLNAGLKTHVPALEGGYWSVLAEDGNPYPYPRQQYSVLLPAGKTIDVLWTPELPGAYTIYDRSLHLTSAGAYNGGMRTTLAVGGTVAAPVANPDAYAVDRDTNLTVPVPGVLGNDTGANLTASLVPGSGPANGTLVALNADGSFTYTPNAGFSGTDGFTYAATNAGGSASATVSITVVGNGAPTTNPDAYAAAEDAVLTVAAPGVLGNDADPDPGDSLAAVLVSGPANGALTLSPNGAFTYTPNPNFNGPDSFTYKANDGQVNGNPATVSIAVAPLNDAPVAVGDSASTPKNRSVVVDVIANDYDPDDPAGTTGRTSGSTINQSSVTIVTPPTRGGTATAAPTGVVTYTPKKNFRGTDVFTYRVLDSAGAASNWATVRVNVK